MKYVPPSVNETAFNCPHCGALAKQFWHKVNAKRIKSEKELPFLISVDDEADWTKIEDAKQRQHLENFHNLMKEGAPFLESVSETEYDAKTVYNLNISSCFNCGKAAIWLSDRLIFPSKGEAPPVNPDLPAEIRRDYEEASAILDLSPRGAAALMRLTIQKLCRELGLPGKNINSDIKALVADGLDPRLQKALDYVRVIGNNAVHPGQIDLRDDRATAETLFRLVNLIAERLISTPKHVDEIYSSLPEDALAAIEKRDGGG